MIMNTRDKEITDQPRLKSFDLKSNLTCNIYTSIMYHIKPKATGNMGFGLLKARLCLNQLKLSYAH